MLINTFHHPINNRFPYRSKQQTQKGIAIHKTYYVNLKHISEDTIDRLVHTTPPETIVNNMIYIELEIVQFDTSLDIGLA